MILVAKGATLTVTWGRSIQYHDERGGEFQHSWDELRPETLKSIRACPLWNEPDTMLSYDILARMIEKFDLRSEQGSKVVK